MLFHEMEFYANGNLIQDIKDLTKVKEEKVYSNLEVIYPSIKKTRKRNEYFLAQRRREIYHKLDAELDRKLPRMRKSQKIAAIQKIKALRPPLALLKKQYLKKGVAPEHIELLVNYKNYQYLQGVHLTKTQQKKLLEKVYQSLNGSDNE